MTIRRFTYTDPKITASRISPDGNFIWTAFLQNTSGNCIIEKQNASKPDQTYFTVQRAVNEISALDLSSTSLYVAYNDTTEFIEKISVTNPLSSFTKIQYPSGIVEAPIDIKVNNTDVWVLLPGSTSGINAKLLKYDTDLVLQTIIDLSKSADIVTDATSISIDESSGDLWLSLNTDPGKIVRVFEISGNLYDFNINIL